MKALSNELSFWRAFPTAIGSFKKNSNFKILKLILFEFYIFFKKGRLATRQKFTIHSIDKLEVNY